jgi:Flp pilus assembly pilin Flp
VKSLLNRAWREDEGVLTFEWILLITVLAIGIVGGLSAVRDALISELGDLSHAITLLDQSYTILNPMEVRVHTDQIDGASDSLFDDDPEYVIECRPADGFISPSADDQMEDPVT